MAPLWFLQETCLQGLALCSIGRWHPRNSGQSRDWFRPPTRPHEETALVQALFLFRSLDLLRCLLVDLSMIARWLQPPWRLLRRKALRLCPAELLSGRPFAFRLKHQDRLLTVLLLPWFWIEHQSARLSPPQQRQRHRLSPVAIRKSQHRSRLSRFGRNPSAARCFVPADYRRSVRFQALAPVSSGRCCRHCSPPQQDPCTRSQGCLELA